MNQKPISEIANLALFKITDGRYSELPSIAIIGLLDDFQYAWLKRLDVPYKFEILDAARALCSGPNKEIFKMTNFKSIDEVRNWFGEYLSSYLKDDDRVILRFSFDGKQIDSEWVEMERYIEAFNK